ncbi:hypothetical protein [Phenylobacterium sp.]|uniref:hypothetical protein n=1 Tax=Phenylobacterium sp. TaxID=1871053 RepID=UPI0035683700
MLDLVYLALGIGVLLLFAGYALARFDLGGRLGVAHVKPVHVRLHLDRPVAATGA